jgi:hypothetical protein
VRRIMQYLKMQEKKGLELLILINKKTNIYLFIFSFNHFELFIETTLILFVWSVLKLSC